MTQVTIPQRVNVGQQLDVSWQVTNEGTGDTPARQDVWSDRVYLSRDEFLDLDADRYLGDYWHGGGLASGQSYSAQASFRVPNGFSGPYYVFVVTDSPGKKNPRGSVFEHTAENNNATASGQPLIIEVPPPSDLQVTSITIPSSAQVGDPISVSWTVTNADDQDAAEGRWTDAVYLSSDNVWDIDDVLLGRANVAHLSGLQPGASYTTGFSTTLPPTAPGSYRAIVRPDIFDEIPEAQNEANNQAPSANTLNVTVAPLQLGVPLETTLSTGQIRVFQLTVDEGQTIRVKLRSDAEDGVNELFLRYDDVPNGILYDSAGLNGLRPNQTALIPSTEPGRYFVLIRGKSEPQSDTPVTLLAESLPLQITDVRSDIGGDGRWVTMMITGAQFDENALVKLVRPGIAELEPERYQVLDGTRILAVFDLRQMPHGLYDVAVYNPNGDQAAVPYRYLIERAVEPDVRIGLGGPRVLAAGDVGTYSFSVENVTNVDAPYVFFEFGVPELGANPDVFNFEYVTFTSNLRGQPQDPALADIPWASLDSAVNTTGETLAPGYALDLATGDFTGLTFNAHTYPGLQEMVDREFEALREIVYEQYPDYVGTLDNGPQGLDDIYPGLYDFYLSEGHPLAHVEDDLVCFQFHITGSATSLTREEFIQQQTAEALALRDRILADDAATTNLRTLAADADRWVTAYLAALEDAGVLRSADEVPPLREDGAVLSLLGTLATGILAGPVGQEIRTTGNLVDFFEQVRTWYGHDASQLATNGVPDRADFDLGLSRTTHFSAFNIYVPYRSCRLGTPGAADVPEPDFARFLDGEGQVGSAATITGPFGYGDEQFVPLGEPLPYSIQFTNDAAASATVSEVRVLTELDEQLDLRSFQLGDIQLGDIQVHIPAGRSSFQGDFDFAQSRGFVLRVSAGIDVTTGTATWLLQAIDPLTGELLDDPTQGLLPPNNSQGIGAGFVGYTIEPKADVATGTTIEAQARVLFDTAPPQDTTALVHTLDAVPPTSSLTVQSLAGGNAKLVQWQAEDDAGGSGVQHVTVYVAEDGGDFRIWQRQTTETEAVFTGEAGVSYEFLAIATDNAGNQEMVDIGRAVPDDGSSVNLGGLPRVDATTEQDLGEPPRQRPARQRIRCLSPPSSRFPRPMSEIAPSEFQTVLRPFTARAFATNIPASHAGIGPMAIAVREDGSVLASGGLTRSQIFEFNVEGGRATSPLYTLDHPAFDMVLDDAGILWVATGGGPLLQVDARDGRNDQRIRHRHHAIVGPVSGGRQDLRLVARRHRDL